MKEIELKITLSNDHVSSTYTSWHTELLISEDSPQLQSSIDSAMRQFGATVDIKEFPPKIVVKTKTKGGD